MLRAGHRLHHQPHPQRLCQGKGGSVGQNNCLYCRRAVLKREDDEAPFSGTRSELREGSPLNSESRALAGLLETYPLSLVALTKGPAGSRLFGRGVDISHPGLPVETADTVGAGDAFTAALVTGMLRHKSRPEIGDRANRVAGYVCSRKGAWPELPSELVSWDRP